MVMDGLSFAFGGVLNDSEVPKVSHHGGWSLARRARRTIVERLQLIEKSTSLKMRKEKHTKIQPPKTTIYQKPEVRKRFSCFDY